MPLQTVSITISGRVQGVFFRKYTIDAAIKSGVTGFVMNTLKGDVYIEATGTESAIAELVKWCHAGSPWSKVEKVSIHQIPFQHYEGFNIRYH